MLNASANLSALKTDEYRYSHSLGDDSHQNNGIIHYMYMIVLYDTYTIITMYNSYVHIYIWNPNHSGQRSVCPSFARCTLGADG